MNPIAQLQLQNGNPLHSLGQICYQTKQTNKLAEELGVENLDPRIFEDPMNSEIYQGICDSYFGSIPIF